VHCYNSIGIVRTVYGALTSKMNCVRVLCEPTVLLLDETRTVECLLPQLPIDVTVGCIPVLVHWVAMVV